MSLKQLWERRILDGLARLGLGSIRRKILAFAILATLIPAISMGWRSYLNSRQVLEEKLVHQIVGASSQVARELDLWIKERRYEVRVVANSYEVTENLAAQGADGSARVEAYLQAIHSKLPDYEELTVIGPDGSIIAASPGPPEEASALAGLAELAGEGAGVRHLPRPGADVIAIAETVRTVDQEPMGVLLATVLTSKIDATLESLRTGTERTLIVDRRGLRIAGSRGLDERGAGIGTDVGERLFRRGSELTEFDDPGGQPSVGALTPVSGTDWGVVAAVDRESAFATVSKLRRFTLWFTLAVVSLVGVLASLLAWTIVDPLERLTDGAAHVAGGDLSVDLPVHGESEIAYLTRVFNDMVRQLRRGRNALAATNQQLVERNTELQALSMVDGLTGLRNRTHLNETLPRTFERVRRDAGQLAVLMIDVDEFKRFNDRFGHLAGDEVLRRMAPVLDGCLRSSDYAARYGGEEFLVLLTDTTPAQARVVAERIRRRFGEQRFETGDPVTLSVGMACFPMSGVDAKTVIASADAALYEAKRAGRNRVCCAEDDVEEIPA